ncbi:MAG: trypsin-like peptidase domain-containing protein [Candidatus Gracilibacteria bacterium]|nr:trypsin-like peptidase domain-containing protein [Candidatus Gracilibacteria bacterium]
MKKTILSIFLIICSIIGGGIGTILVVKYLPEYINLKPEVIKEETTKTEKFTSVLSLQTDITKIVKDISPSIVSIIIKKDLTVYRQDPFGFFQTPVGTVKSKVGGGTGFFITKDGKIITNKHVVSDSTANYTVITNDGSEYDAEIVAIDPVTDLAILQISIDKAYEPLEIVSENDEINIGQFVIATGNALAEYQNSVSLGVISGKNRTISNDTIKLSGLIQTDAAINPGNSGGPLVNLDGKVIGINTAIVSGAEGLGFSIPLTDSRITYMLKSIEKYGSIKKPFIGINYITNTPGIQKQLGLKVNYGAYIPEKDGSIVSGSSAETSGLELGDIILEADGKKISLDNNLSSILQTKIPGYTMKLKVLKKNGEEKEIDITLGES